MTAEERKKLWESLPPGSSQAIAAGCRCPVMDNGHGKGYHCDNGEQFVINDHCPVHSETGCICPKEKENGKA